MTTAARAPLISLHALQRSRTTLEDFAASYLPLHGLAQADYFAHSDVLTFVSAALYELDEANEALTGAGDWDGPSSRAADLAGPSTGCVSAALASLGLLSDQVDTELRAGDAFWLLERRICAQLAAGLVPAAADVLAAHEAKSFDYRVLHLVLLQRIRRPVDAALLAFLRIDEQLVDIGDDLTDYEDDVVANSFNVFRCFVALHGAAAAPARLIEHISGLERRHAAALARLPEATQRHFWARHADASQAEGQSGRWALPRAIAIADEPAFRASCELKT